MAAQLYLPVKMIFANFVMITCLLVQNSYQDERDCFLPTYTKSNNVQMTKDVYTFDLLGCERVRRDVPQKPTETKLVSIPPTNKQLVNNTTAAVNATSIPPIIVTTPKAETKVYRNLGENGTGIHKECDPSGNITNYNTSKPICVSEPIVAEDGNPTGLNNDEFPESEDKLLKEHNITQTKNDTHDYYNSTFATDREAFLKYWAAIENSGDLKVHHVLSQSHRRAGTIPLSFDFPFYGQIVRNVTIATGGFLYTGDYVHSWLAATQYIAPLMANFDTALFNDSYVKYIDNGTALTVLWENVILQDKHHDGRFTFAATLHANGDIVFAYKSIPLPIDSILDTNHPVKVGLSDAFIIDRVYYLVRKKTIYEYHRVDFKTYNISNNTIIVFTALPTCPQYKTCNSCLQHETVFKCTWCSKVKRCSHGNDRQKHDWILNNCEEQKIINATQCSADENIVFNTETGDNSSPSYTTTSTGKNVSSSNATDAVSMRVSGVGRKTDDSDSGGSPGAIAAGLVALVTAVGLAAWFVYAYRNPHTNSGQLLVKYRPSQWSWRRGEARYTAATIHM